MKPPGWIAPVPKSRINLVPIGRILLGLLVGMPVARAQDVMAPVPVEDVVPVALQQAQAGANLPVTPAQGARNAAPDTSLIQWGPATLRAHLFYRFLYGNGIPAAAGQDLTTAIHNVSPDFLVDLGTHWTIDYAPTWIFYSNPAFNDTLDQSARLAGWGTYQDWVLRLYQSYATTTAPLVETGQQTKQKAVSTTFDASYSFNSRLALDTALAQSFQSAANLAGAREWSLTDSLHYKFSPRLDLAPSLALGYVDMSVGTDMTYVRPQVQVTWRLTDKVSLNGHGGYEDRQFRSANTPDLKSPIYGGAIEYRPLETTTFRFGADRTVAASYLENQITDTKGLTLSLNQRLLGKLFLDVGVSRQTVAYLSTAGSAGVGRDDDTSSFNIRLSSIVRQRMTVALTYYKSRNSSNVPGFALLTHQIGVEVAYRF